MKKYNLHCFGCGDRFPSKDYVHRIDGKPYCEECYAESLANQAQCEYERYYEEKEAKKYQEAMMHYEKAMKDWRVKYEEAERKRKETGEPIPSEIWDWMPQKPLDAEERQLKNYMINRYGEW